jgi:hypothetical protein
MAARIDDLLKSSLKKLPPKPPDTAKQDKKKRYSEQISAAVAGAIADELRHRGLHGTRPGGIGDFDKTGAERRMSGGLGAKKVDVTWATEESGLLLAFSIKSINFRDMRAKNFQKNLVNRRGDMLMEGVTLHRRFPYAVLAGFFFLDKDAANDGTAKRNSTFTNAHARLRLFTGRNDPAGREEQFERFYLMLLDVSPASVSIKAYEVGKPEQEISLEQILSELLQMVAERNFDFYDFEDGRLRRLSVDKKGSGGKPLPASQIDIFDEPDDDEEDDEDVAE